MKTGHKKNRIVLRNHRRYSTHATGAHTCRELVCLRVVDVVPAAVSEHRECHRRDLHHGVDDGRHELLLQQPLLPVAACNRRGSETEVRTRRGADASQDGRRARRDTVQKREKEREGVERSLQHRTSERARPVVLVLQLHARHVAAAEECSACGDNAARRHDVQTPAVVVDVAARETTLSRRCNDARRLVERVRGAGAGAHAARGRHQAEGGSQHRHHATHSSHSLHSVVSGPSHSHAHSLRSPQCSDATHATHNSLSTDGLYGNTGLRGTIATPFASRNSGHESEVKPV